MENDKQAEQQVVEKGVNFAIHELEAKISNDINSASLPVSVVRLILNNLLVNIQLAENAQVQKEYQDFSNSVKELQNNNSDGKE